MRCATALVEPDPRAEAAAAVVRAHREVPLGRRVARAEEHHLRVEVQDARQRGEHHVGPLLLAQARDDADERHVGPLGEAHLALQGALARRPCPRGRRRRTARRSPDRCRGSHARSSMPLRMPTRSAPRKRTTASSPAPPSAVRISSRIARRDGRQLGGVVEAALERVHARRSPRGRRRGTRSTGCASPAGPRRGTSPGARGCGS